MLELHKELSRYRQIFVVISAITKNFSVPADLLYPALTVVRAVMLLLIRPLKWLVTD